VEIRVLGPVQVRAAGRAITLDGPITEALLAVLAVDADRIVPVHALVDAGWDTDPPATVRRQVRNRLARLRAALLNAGFPPTVITAQGTGFVLSTEGVDLDLARFHHGVRRAADATEPSDAVVALRAALDLWRGPAFAGLDSPRLLALSDQLAEQRLSLWERCFDLELQLGRHPDVVAELVGLHALHPAREALAGQLMLAYHRCGRQVDALNVFARTRAHLAEEFGVTPGELLCRLHQDILQDSPRLRLSNVDARRSVTRGVNQLPMLTPTFVGRSEEVGIVLSVLRTPGAEGPRIVALSGMAGIGKTTLAVSAARQCAGDFPDGCLYADLRGVNARPAEPIGVLGAFLRSLGVAPSHIPHDGGERAVLFRERTADRRILIVLDNAHGESQVRPLIPGTPTCAVLITSRPTLAGLDTTATVELPPLTTVESTQLLSTVVGADRLRQEPDAVQSLVTACAGLPLAVRIVAARLAHQRDLDLRRFAASMHDRSQTLPAMRVGDLDVHATFMLSYRQLSAAASGLLDRLGVSFQLDYSERTLGALSGSDVGAAIQELTNAHLMDPVRADEPRYRLHDLVRAFAATRASEALPEHEAYAAVEHLVVWYLDAVNTAARFERGGLDPAAIATPAGIPLRFESFAEAVAWFDDEAANLAAAVVEASRRGWHELTWKLAFALRVFFQSRHLLDEWLTVIELGLDAARAIGDVHAEARLLEGLTQIHFSHREYAASQAASSRAQQLYDRAGDRIGVARCHELQGNALDLLGVQDAAEKHYRAAMAEPEYAALPYYAKSLQLNLGALYGRRGRYAEAMEMFRPVLDLALAERNWELACVAHHNIAVAHRRLGTSADGMDHARAEIEIAREHRFTLREARGWEVLGNLCQDQDLPEGVQHIERAILLYEQMNDPHAEALRTGLRDR
jgi:DNA-binding SARP family transcriptional activator/tetratricopeptide (TPR) repeat protein